MPAQWRIDYWPGCVAHAFLSHCAEDRDRLVQPVFEELLRRRIAPWMDRVHYPLGREVIEALQEELLRCRHVIYFVTPAMLCQGRGWPGAERALTATIQQHLRDGQEIAHVEMALLFVKTTDPAFQRSVWRSLVDKAESCPHPAMLPAASSDAGRRDWRENHVLWAAERVEQFVRQEEQWARELEVRFGEDPSLGRKYRHEPNLVRRLLAQDPPPLPNV
jgi:hypothetical protein